MKAPRLELFALCLAACGSAPPPPPSTPKPVEQAPHAEKDAAALPAASIYVYSPIGKRDPFQSASDTGHASSSGNKANTPLQPLQRWPIDALKLTFTETATDSPLAMIEDPNGRGWPVRLGTLVGQNWGRVTAIQPDRVIITETITDNATGRVYGQTQSIRMKLRDEEKRVLEQLNEGDVMGASR